MVAQKNHTLLMDNRLHRQNITPTEHPTMATYRTSYISANHARLAACILEALVILWRKSLKSEHKLCTLTAATRQQSDTEITHVFKNQNQGTL